MIGLDTNVLVRYIMQDDKKQSALASKLIESLTADTPGFIPIVALVELCWVLDTGFGLTRHQIFEAMTALLAVDVFRIDHAAVVASAARAYASGKADFADCLIARLSASAGCTRTMTFDRAAAKTGGMTLIG